ncbi:MAG: protein kinase, partial [Alistipes sp.]|nr:protein kinase [Alistipes sp.]
MAFLDKGDSIGAYRVQSLIKSKVYTETYRVESEQGVVCFLKLFVLNRVPQHLVDPQTKRVREIEFAQQLSHKNIVGCIESGEIEIGGANCQYYVTNYFNGVLLADKIGQEGKLQEDVAVKIFRGILEALKYLHSRVPVLCHNDLDPTNIILNSVNNDEAELIDLGHISERAYGTASFDTSDIDPLYHANETRVSIFDEQSDIFSACATLYAMLTGSAPWNIELPEEGTYREKFAPLHQYRKSNKLDFGAVEASDKIRHILRRGLELKNTERYANVDEILSDLDSSD